MSRPTVAVVVLFSGKDELRGDLLRATGTIILGAGDTLTIVETSPGGATPRPARPL